MQRLVLVSLGLLTLLQAGCSISEAMDRQFLKPSTRSIETPKDYGHAYQDLSIRRSDGIKLHGWFVEPEDPAKGTVIFCHGNAGNVSFFGYYYDFLVDAGYNVLLYDYAGFGKSEGKAQLDTLFDDMEHVLRWIGENTEGSARDNVAVFGVSLGTLVASRGAGDFSEIDAVILEDVVSPRDNLNDFLKRQEYGAFARWVALRYLLNFVLPWRLEPSETLRSRSVPMLIVAGAEDRMFDMRGAVRLYSAYEGNSTMMVLPHTGHAPGKLRDYAGEYQEAVLRFLASAFLGSVEDTWSVELVGDTVTLKPVSRDFADELALQVSVVSKGKLSSFRRVWLGTDPVEIDFGADLEESCDVFVHQYFDVIRVDQTWHLRPDDLRQAGQAYHAISSAADELFSNSLPPDGQGLQELIQMIQDWSGIDDRLHPIAEAELTRVFYKIGQARWQQKKRQDARAWLWRVLDSIPAKPKRHTWGGNAIFRIGFRFEREANFAADALLQHYEAVEDKQGIADVAKCMLRLEPANPEWQQLSQGERAGVGGEQGQ